MGVQPQDALRIVSYNVRYFGHALRGLASTKRPKREIAVALASLDPPADIICLQEVETISIRSRIAFRRAHARETQLESFMTALTRAYTLRNQPLPYDAFHFRAHRYGPSSLPIYTTGLAVLINRQRLTIAAHNQDSPQQITHHHIARLRDQKQTRICAHLRAVDHAGRGFHIFNTHLSLPTPFARQFWTVREKMGFGPNQVAEARALSNFIRSHAGTDPFIVCGDFNSPPGSPVYRFLTDEARFVGAQRQLGLIDEARPRAFPTAGLARLRMHLDHLFGADVVHWIDMEETHCFGDRTSRFHGLSDHIPLIARFRLPGRSG